MKEPDEFERRLEDHFPLPMEWIIGAPVTEADLSADGESFLAFAGMMGVQPPAANPNDDDTGALRSS